MKGGKFDGHGQYTFPDGMKYVGQFKEGFFHGEGVIYTPEGSYRAKFDMGEVGVIGPQLRVARSSHRLLDVFVCTQELSGTYVFNDGLVFKDKGWEYCTPEDRRFHTEITGEGVRPAGECQLANDAKRVLPEGCYDVGDGYYNPDSGKVHAFDGGAELRAPDVAEVEWATTKCRVGEAADAAPST